jgi:coproporphyrinogen III oxidase
MEPELLDIAKGFKSLQESISSGLEAYDGKASFLSDLWTRPEGGGGDTRVLTHGRIIEKGGVNFSHVSGPLPERIAKRLALPTGMHFDATGTSLVIHPLHPFVPVIHMNVRYFEIENGTWWFGGGIDLTPAYISKEDAIFFHSSLKAACEAFGETLYPTFKAHCDAYFYLPHRQETRGIGGLFFDFLKPGDLFKSKAEIWDFVQTIGNTFLPVYLELIRRNESKEYSEAHKQFQLWRRGRYVEFNLLYDKGTAFGLDTGGRTESILMSLPPLTAWQYNYVPEAGSPEAETLSLLRPVDWI